MRPEQARAIIESAREKIDEWKSRLMLGAGNGVEVTGSTGNQYVSLYPIGEEPPQPEPPLLEIVLWVKFDYSRTSLASDKNAAVPIPSFATFSTTGWFPQMFLQAAKAGEYLGYAPTARPDGRVTRSDLKTAFLSGTGYYNHIYDSYPSSFSPLISEQRAGTVDTRWSPSQDYVTANLVGIDASFSVFSSDDTPSANSYTASDRPGNGYNGWYSVLGCRSSTKLSLAVKGYLSSTLSYKRQTGQLVAFDDPSAINVGAYDMGFGMSRSGSEAVIKTTARVGFAPTSLQFSSLEPSNTWDYTQGNILRSSVYRKV